MSKLSSGARSTLARTGVVAAVAAASIGGFAGTAQAANPTMTLSSSTGSSAGGNTLTLTVPTTATTKFTSGKVAVLFFGTTSTAANTAVCPGTTASSNNVTANVSHASTTGTAGTLFSGTIRYLSTTKVSATVPDLRATPNATPGNGPTTWLACAYNMGSATYSTPVTQASTGSAGAGVLGASSSTATSLIGKAVYTVAAAPSIADSTTDNTADGGPDWSAAGDNGPLGADAATPPIYPTTGPALGSQTITVYGWHFSTPITATLGGSPLTNISVASDGLSFSAVTPSHAAGAVTLSVTTNGGTVTKSSAFTYKNGITVSPTTTPQATSVDLDIQGVGFTGSTMDFSTTDGTTPDNNKSHVYLAQGTYNPANSAAASNTGADFAKTVAEATECVNVAVISDTEIICTLNAASKITYVNGTADTDGNRAVGTYAAGNLANGTYTVTVVDNGADNATPAYQSVLSSGATFTVSDF